MSCCRQGKGGLIPLYLQDGALGLSLEIGEDHLVMGGPQQLYHLDVYIPLRINSEESKAAFHRKRRVPGWGGGAETLRGLGLKKEGWRLASWVLNPLPFLSSATDGGDAPSVHAFLTWCPPVLPGGEKKVVASLKLK